MWLAGAPKDRSIPLTVSSFILSGLQQNGEQRPTENGAKISSTGVCILGLGLAVPPWEMSTERYLEFVLGLLQLDDQPRAVEALKKVPPAAFFSGQSRGSPVKPRAAGQPKRDRHALHLCR